MNLIFFIYKCLIIYVSIRTHFDIPNGGVLAFDLDERLNLMVTANANTNVHIYNPFVEEPNGILKVKN